MEERTFISSVDLFDLIENVGKCKCYDDAKKYLNTFVIDNVCKQYETEDGTKFRNSSNTKDIKRETLISIMNDIDTLNVIDKVSDRALEQARILAANNSHYDDTAIINAFGIMRVERNRALQYIESWRKEPAPLKEKKTQRLRPTKGKEYYVDIMFERLKELGFLAKDESKEAWRYLCGISDEVPEKTMKWLGSFFDFCVLYDFFLVSARQSYFKYNRGVRSFVVAQFGFDYENGFKQQLSRDYTKKEETIKKEAWFNMKDPQMI